MERKQVEQVVILSFAVQNVIALGEEIEAVAIFETPMDAELVALAQAAEAAMLKLAERIAHVHDYETSAEFAAKPEAFARDIAHEIEVLREEWGIAVTE